MGENEKKRSDDHLVQKAIDPTTGRDITAELINQRLEELKHVANEIIKAAIEEYNLNPDKKREIYEIRYREIHQELGSGSIGPATAAVGPLMYSKMEELTKALDIPENERL